jgi:hypothetical protein
MSVRKIASSELKWERFGFFYCLNSTSSFLSAVFNYYRIFPQIVPVLFISDHKSFAGNVGDVRFASSVSGKQRCVMTV